MFKKSDVKDIYELSPMQAGMLFHYMMDRESTTYVERMVFSVSGEIDVAVFEAAFNKLVEKYDILRTVFLYEKVKRPLQVVLKQRQASVDFQDISGMPEPGKNKTLETIVTEDLQRNFQLDREIPMRVTIVKTHPEHYKLLWTSHHIITDGWCLGIIIKDFNRYYNLLLNGKAVDVVTADPYSRYIKWLGQQDREEGLRFWRDYLSDYDTAASLPRWNNETDAGYRTETYEWSLDEALSRSLEQMAKEHGVTVNILFRVTWGILLQQYNTSDDVVFGSVVSGRSAEINGIEEMVGLFINTVPVRITNRGGQNFAGLINRNREHAAASAPYEYLPLADIQSGTPLNRDLLNHILVFENYPIQQSIAEMADDHRERKGFRIDGAEIHEQTNYDFNIIVDPGSRLQVKFIYNASVYDPGQIRRIATHFSRTTRWLLANPLRDVSQVVFITEEEKKQVLEEFNDTAGDFPHEKTLHLWFEEQVEKSSDKCSVITDRNHHITYRELDRRANRLGARLQEKGVGPETPVAFKIQRSAEVIIAILGILKAGGAYLPIDPEYPEERIDYMLKDSGATILLRENDIEDTRSAVPGSQAPAPVHSPAQLCYILFTSGSTGQPKGIMLEHRNMVNLMHHHFTRTNLPGNRVLQFSTISFDASAHEIFSALLCGGALFLITEELRGSIPGLFRFISSRDIGTVFLPIAYLKTVFGAPEYARQFPSCIRHIQSAGDQVVVSRDFARFLEQNHVYLHNHYGPAETHVVTTFTVDPAGEIPRLPSIGKPLLNTAIFILGGRMQPQPVGVAGQMFIGGAQVGRGYLNNPELTAEKFIDLNRSYKTYRTYKTGDLARWLPDGNVQFLGRIDHQVKIRGFRVEPGEIETRLMAHPSVNEAVVAPRTDPAGEKYLCAYFTTGTGEETPDRELRAHLSQTLPGFMIPSFFVELETIPLTPNGKVDRRALPEPEVTPGAGVTPPGDETQKKLVELWAGILGRHLTIGIDDNFFQLGGHSLKAMQLAASIHKELEIDIALADIFRHATIRALARYVTGAAERRAYAAIEAAGEEGYCVLSSAQKRLYALMAMMGDSTAYNMPSAMVLKGTLDTEKLENTFRELIRRHQGLRTSFHLLEGKPVQRVHPAVDFKIGPIGPIGPIKKAITGFIKPFDLARAPLIRAGLNKTGELEHVFIVDLHHIISDGVSMGVLVKDFMAIYSGGALAPLRLQYHDYARWQNSREQQEFIKKQESFWLDQFRDGVPVLELPYDHPRPGVQSFDGHTLSFDLPGNVSAELKSLAGRQGVTLFMVLLAIYEILLAKLSGQEDIVVGTPSAGRRHADLQDIIGMFVNTLPLRNFPAGGKTVRHFLQEIKETTLMAFDNQEYPFEDLAEALDLQRDAARSPLFDTMLVLQSQSGDIPVLEIPGLKLEPFAFDNPIAKFDMILDCTDGGDALYFNLNYCVGLFEEGTVRRFIRYFKNIAAAVVDDPAQRLAEIDFIPGEEKHQLLETFNDTAARYPADKTVYQLFREQAAKTPNSIAVTGSGQQLTYGELNLRANRLASFLHKKGGGPGAIVAIMTEPSAEMIIGVLGILETGAAYLPIDPGYPRDRIDYMLADSNAKMLLTSHDIAHEGQGQTLPLQTSALAYIIYTSGTTGKPRGVAVSHRSLVNLCFWHNSVYEVEARDKALKYAGFGFDASVWEVFPYLLAGASLCIPPEAVKLDMARLNRYLEETGVTIAFLPAQVCEQFMHQDNRSLRILLTGGDKLKRYIPRDYLLYNNYGPTEYTVVTTHFAVRREWDNIPIGTPVANTQVYILSRFNELQPMGAAGELCVSGDGLALGYLNNPELTAEKFINLNKTYRTYKTGDLARWLPDGNILFLGRIDHQVKIRGYRIEPGEIETFLQQHPGVREVLVLGKGGSGEQYLCAYVTASDPAPGSGELARYLAQTLPQYMVPAHFVFLKAFPLTVNGKVDRRALPEPESGAETVAYLAPSNERETVLAEVLQEVLGLEQVGMKDNFFRLGGDSIKAIQVSSRLMTYEFRLEVSDLFANPELGDCAARMQPLIPEPELLASKPAAHPVYTGDMAFKKSDVQDMYLLTPMQAGMLFHHRMNRDSQAYFQQTVFTVKGTIDPEVYEKTVNKLIETYDILRTLFLYEKVKRPVQVVLKRREATITYLDAQKQADGFVEEFTRQDRRKGFDLQRDILVRVSIIRTRHDRYQVIWSHHHILMDGWCLGILMQDFSRIYAALLNGEPVKQRPVTPYSHYIAWLAKQDSQEGLDYWRNYLRDYENRAVVPAAIGGVVDTEEPGTWSFTLDEGEDGGFNRLARDFGVTANVLFRTLWGVLLQRYNNTGDVVFGAVVSGRPAEIPGIEEMVGLFINTVPVRIRVTVGDNVQRFSQLLHEHQQSTGKAKRYEYLPLPDIQAETVLNRDLINHILVFENLPIEDQLKETGESPGSGFLLEDVTGFGMTNYDLTVVILPTRPLTITFDYNGSVYTRQALERIATHFRTILSRVMADPDIPVCRIEAVDQQERERLLFDLNKDRDAGYPGDKTIHGLFLEQVQRWPENIALVLGDRQEIPGISYRELNEMAELVAAGLLEKGVGPGAIVAIMTEPSLEMMAGILGILKCGAAYLPIDPEYPWERIDYMLKDSNAALLVSTEDLEAESRAARKVGPAISGTGASGLAYIIYTSGTTGRPKGSMIEHSNVVRLMVNDRNLFDFNEGDVWTLFHSFCFDFSVWEMYGALVFGGRLVMVPRDVARDTRRYLQVLKEQKVTVLNQTPSAFYNLAAFELAEEGSDLLLRYVIFGGEALKPAKLKDWRQKYPGTRLINMYGITETTVHVTFKEITEAEIEKNISNIGGPIPTLSVYVVDCWGNLVPEGVAGELWVGGGGVARGYLNRPELTAERFSPAQPGYWSHRSHRSYISYYKSGDLVRWLPGGDLEYLGRIDHQVKIRGFRVELGEIETRILRHRDVKEALVLARGSDGDTYLCAYIVGGETSPDEFKRFLSRHLPGYMIPSRFVRLEAFPLTPNGKIDRKALPEPGGPESRYTAPSTPLEEKMADLWQVALGIDSQGAPIGVADNFFERGGHSLKATQLAAAIHKEFGVNIPLAEIFGRPTIREMAGYITGASTEQAYAAIEPAEPNDRYPLSSAQKRLYVLMQMDGGSIAYNMPFAVQLRGALDTAKLESVFQRLTERHAVLRTSFHLQEGEPVQHIHPEVEFKIGPIGPIGPIKETKNDFIKPFDLERAPLLRVTLALTGDMEHLCLMDMHHIVSDGVSMGILVRDFIALYGGEELSPLRLQYHDYAHWQNSRGQQEVIGNQGAFWQSQFPDVIPVLELPYDFPRPETQSFEGHTIPFELSVPVSAGLNHLARQQGTTLFMVLLALYNALLARLSGQEDIVVGTPSAGRRHADLQDIIGMFVNTLPLRNFPELHKTMGQFLQEIKNNTLRAFDNQEYPFEELVDRLDLERDAGRNPLFDVMLVLQNQAQDIPAFEIPGLKLEPAAFTSPIAKFDMNLTCVQGGDKLFFSLDYCVRLFNEETVRRFIQYFMNIASAIVKDPAQRLGDIDFIPEEEKQRLLEIFNDTAAEYPSDKTIHQLFREQVAKTPGNIAVTGSGQHLTYGELNLRANRLASYLHNKGGGPGTIVAIMTEPSAEMIIGVLGILETGAAYLPIDPGYPRDRIDYMLADSNAKMLLTSHDIAHEGQGQAQPLQTSALAYIIYTSGTTGRPKGVAVSHRSLVNLCFWHNSVYEVGARDKALKYAGLGFDASVWEIFPYLSVGASLCIPPEAVKLDMGQLNRYLEKTGVTIAFLPAQVCEQFMYMDNRSLRILLTGGDKLKRYIPRDYVLYNNYGPTEYTVVTTHFAVRREWSNIPVGAPVANTQVYILSRFNELQPMGAAGELCISGDGLALGYLNNPELTAEKFISLHRSYRTYRTYKTGDLARWLPDGNLEFLGRIDRQVKIRGFRIELAEIEQQLLAHEGVGEAVLDVRQDHTLEPYLCGYVVSAPGATFSEPQLLDYLAGKLPHYMIPAFIVEIDEIPLTVNHKLDRQRLPGPSARDSGEQYKPPCGETEKKLARIFAEVLGIETGKISRDADFFRMGGHSLRGVSVINMIHKTFDKKIGIQHLFQHPTATSLARFLDEKETASFEQIETQPLKPYYELSYTQKRIWVLQKLEPASPVFNMPMQVTVPNFGPEERTLIQKVLSTLVDRHDGFRTRLRREGEEMVQVVEPGTGLTLETVDLTGLPREQAEERRARLFTRETMTPFDLDTGPLWRVKLVVYKTPRLQCDLFFNMHHIVSDGWSMDVLQREFGVLYQAYEKGLENPLEPMRIQYKDYAEWQNRLLQDRERMKDAMVFWKQQLGGQLPVLKLPYSYSGEGTEAKKSAGYRLVVPGAVTGKLCGLANDHGASLFMVLLAVFKVFLSQLRDQEDILMAIPGAARQHEDLKNIVGVFVNTLILRSRVDRDETFIDFLVRVRENTLNVLEYQGYPMELICEELNIQYPEVNVFLNMPNIGGGDLQPLNDPEPFHLEQVQDTKFDILCYLTQYRDGIEIMCHYFRHRFSPAAIEKMMQLYVKLLEQIVHDPGKPLKEYRRTGKKRSFRRN